MRFARYLVLLPLLSLLAVYSPTTLLFVVQVTAGEVAEYKQMRSSRMAAAIEEEGDLLTYSVMAIHGNRSAEVEKLYLIDYDNSRYGVEMCGVSLYQVGLIYMNYYNDQRDDTEVTDCFQRVVREFPGIHVAGHAQARLLTMRQQAREPVQKNARELLATQKPQQNLGLYKTSLDPDIALLSRRTVLKDRVDEAAEPHLPTVSDPAVPAGIKEEALYQLGLVCLAPDDPHSNRDKVIEYLRHQLLDYLEGELSNKVGWHLDRALDVQLH